MQDWRKTESDIVGTRIFGDEKWHIFPDYMTSKRIETIIIYHQDAMRFTNTALLF